MILQMIGFFLLVSSGKSYSATCTASASGNWTVASVWSCGHVPVCNDAIVIPVGCTVTIVSDVYLTGGGCANTNVQINGILLFSGNSARLNLVPTATVNIAQGGGIRTNVNNNSQKIVIGSGGGEWTSNNGGLDGPWAITDGVSQSVLPVELISFNATPGSEGIMVDWVTASEHNNWYFELERSSNGVDFITIGKLMTKSPQGNSLLKLEYSVLDMGPPGGINYYRLKQVDLNAGIVYHPLIYARFIPDATVFRIYPNPNKGKFFIDASGIENNHSVQIFIYDKAAKLLQSYTTQTDDIVSKAFSIDLGENREKGVYTVTIMVEGVIHNTNLVIE